MPKNKGRLKDDKGMALITVLLILVLLTTLGMYSIWTSNSETALGGNERLNKTAYYIAEAGLNETLARFSQISGMPDYISGTQKYMIGTCGNNYPANHSIHWAYKGLISGKKGFGNYSTYIYPTFEDTYNGVFHNYTNSASWHPSPHNWLVLYNTDFQYPDSLVQGGYKASIGFPVYHVISKGWIKDTTGKIISTATLSADVTCNSIDVQAPGGVYGGNTVSWNGSSEFDAPGDLALVAGTSQSVAGFPGTGSAENNTMENMSSFLGFGLYQLRGMATYKTVGTTTPPTTAWGTAASPSILFIDNACKYSGTPAQAGGVTFTGGTGYGLMIVTGDLTLHGNFTWNGLVYVMGNVPKSNGTNNVNGAMMVQGTSDYTGNVTVTLNRQILEQISRHGFNNKMIVWRDERQ